MNVVIQRWLKKIWKWGIDCKGDEYKISLRKTQQFVSWKKDVETVMR